MQIGIVVRDLDATIRRYVDDYGIGPWEIWEFNPETAKDWCEYGRPVEHASGLAVTRVGATQVGQVMWELIQPLDDKSLWARFLAEKGEGVHHIAVATPNFDDVVAAQAQRGNKLVLNGTFSGIPLAYLPTDRDLGVIIEIFGNTTDTEQKPGAT